MELAVLEIALGSQQVVSECEGQGITVHDCRLINTVHLGYITFTKHKIKLSTGENYATREKVNMKCMRLLPV